VAPCIFSLGYQERTIDEYLDALVSAGIGVVVDVRETAWSRKQGFSKKGLQQRLGALGITYVHASFAGNPQSIRRAATSHEACLRGYSEHLDQNDAVLLQFDELLSRWLLEGVRICLLCYERHPDDCHRSILLDAWVSQHRPDACIRHIGSDGAPRLM
jgi:uncharacterized protein (DUF488 family)